MPVQAQGYLKLDVDLSSTETPTWTNVPGVTVAAGLGFGENDIDVTDFDTAPGTQETISGARPNVPLTFTMHDESDDAAQIAMHAAGDANTPMQFRLRRGTKAQVFSGVPNLTLSGPVAGVVTYSGSIKPQAKPTRTTVS